MSGTVFPAFAFLLRSRHLHKFTSAMNRGPVLALFELLGGWWMMGILSNYLQTRRSGSVALRLIRVGQPGICRIRSLAKNNPPP